MRLPFAVMLEAAASGFVTPTRLEGHRCLDAVRREVRSFVARVHQFISACRPVLDTVLSGLERTVGRERIQEADAHACTAGYRCIHW